MKKVEKQEGLVDATSFTQKDIPALLEKVNKQIAGLKKNIPNENKTTSSLEGFGKIDSIKRVGILIKAYAKISFHEEAYEKAFVELKEYLPEGYKRPALIIDGHSVKEWKEHIQSRIGEVANETKLKGLEEIKKTLEDNLSVQDKLARKLQSVGEMLLGEEIEE